MAEISGVKLEDFIYKPDTFGTIRAIGIDKYPGEMPIVRELLQNADDVGAPHVRFKLDKNEIVAENDGRPFTKPDEVDKIEESDFYRISHIGVGKTEEEMTGTFGIGFTSVFHITDTPRIVSNGWDFEIRVNDVPSIKRVPFDRITRLHLPIRLSETELSKKIKAEPFDLRKLEMFEKQLIHEVYRDIFFLKKVKNIEAYKKGTKLFSVYKKVKQVEDLTESLTRQCVTIYIISIINGRRKRRTENWMIYFLNGIDIPTKLEALGQNLKQKVAIAIPLNFKGTRITKGFDTQNYVYYTLPVMPTDFNFRYNASKLYITSGRSEFVTKEGLKREWNLWQMDNLAELLPLVIDDLISRKVKPKIIYQFVPISSQVRDLLDERIFNSFKAKVESKEIRLFYTSQGGWREKGKIYMNWDGLHEVLPEDSGLYLIHPNLKKYAAVFQSYGIEKIRLEEFVNYLEQKYGTSAYKSKKSEDPSRIRKIFEYLGKKRIESHLMEKLRQICILLTEEGILRSYEYRVYLPTDEKMPLINKGDIVHHSTYNTRASKKFLQKKLKIKKMDLHHLILGSFLPRVSDYSADQKFEFVSYLVRRQRDVFRKRNTVQELRKSLRDIIIVENINDPAGSIFFADAELKEIFEDKLNYISFRYEQEGKKENVKWRGFLKKIGVEETPHPDKVTAIAQEIGSVGYTSKNVRKVELLLKFLVVNWRKFYSKHTEELKELREYGWIPTDKKPLAFPTEVYVNKSVRKLVGGSQNFLAVKIPRNKGLIKVLGLLTEARLDDVIKFILEKRGEEKTEIDKPVGFRVYSFLNKKVDSLTTDHTKVLTENRTIWFKGRLWKPSKLYLQDYRNEFGPNGWLRGYIKNDKLSKLHGLCLSLGINRTTKTPDDYLDWLADVADESENQVLKNWKIKLIRNTYSKLAPLISIISEEQLEKLRDKKIVLTSEPKLRLPYECYLLRKGEEIIYERILKAGISVPIVEAENAEHERLYLRLGINEIAYSLVAKRADKNQAHFDKVLTESFRLMLPWLDGFEFSSAGSISEYNLMFQQLKVYRVNKLKVAYLLEGKEGVHKGNPIKDICCYEGNDESALYLDKNFRLEKNEHLHLLSLNLIKNLNPAIDKVRWSLVIPSLLVLGHIIGISPYDREVQKQEEVSTWVPPKWEKEEKPFKAPRLEKILKTEEEFVVKHEPTSKDMLDELIYEAARVMEEESSGKPVDISKMFRKKKRISTVKTSPSITYNIEPKIIAAKNWKVRVIDGEEVYSEEGISLPPTDKIRKLRRLTKKIVDAMGFDPEIVNICVARIVTDGYNKDGQLFFNAARDDSPFRWFGVVARELAYNYSHRHYPHVKAMVDLITRGLENIGKIFPEFIGTKNT